MESEGGRPFITLIRLRILPHESLIFIIHRLRLLQEGHKPLFDLDLFWLVNNCLGIAMMFFH